MGQAGREVVFDSEGPDILTKATRETNGMRGESGNHLMDMWGYEDTSPNNGTNCLTTDVTRPRQRRGISSKVPSGTTWKPSRYLAEERQLAKDIEAQSIELAMVAGSSLQNGTVSTIVTRKLRTTAKDLSAANFT